MPGTQLELLDHKYGSSVIRQRASDGYVNATAMCQAMGKNWFHYRELEGTRKYISALQASSGIPMTALVLTRVGGDVATQGTWVHPQVAIHLAQWLSPDFAVLVTKWVFDWMSGHGSPLSGRGGYIPDFVTRFHLNQKQVPVGYFSVISELFVVAYALLEREGYVLPKKGAQGQNISPDVSVGTRFAKWLRDNYPSLSNVHITYTHIFFDGRQVPTCRAYPNSMLGIFRDYVINVWLREHAPTYLGTVDPASIPYLTKIVASLPPPEQYPALPPAA